MKTYPFCAPVSRSTGLQPLLHGDSVHLHNHYTDQHTTFTKYRSNVDIAHTIHTITTLLSNTPYIAHTHHATFQTTLLTALHHFDNSTYTSVSGNPCPPSPHPPYATTSYPHSIQLSPRHWAQSLYRVLPRHDAYLAHTHNLVSTLPPNNYTRDSLNIIDHLYIGILPTTLHTSIKIYLTSVERHQLTTHHHYYHFPTTPTSIIALYHDKANTQQNIKAHTQRTRHR